MNIYEYGQGAPSVSVAGDAQEVAALYGMYGITKDRLQSIQKHCAQWVLYMLPTKAQLDHNQNLRGLIESCGFKEVGISGNPVHNCQTFLHLFVWYNPQRLTITEDKKKFWAKSFYGNNPDKATPATGCGDAWILNEHLKNYINIERTGHWEYVRDPYGRFAGSIWIPNEEPKVEPSQIPDPKNFNRGWIFFVHERDDLTKVDPRFHLLDQFPGNRNFYACQAHPRDAHYKKVA